MEVALLRLAGSVFINADQTRIGDRLATTAIICLVHILWGFVRCLVFGITVTLPQLPLLFWLVGD